MDIPVKIKLDIGCSDVKINPKFIGVDPYYIGADLQVPAGNLPFAGNSVDEIYSSHMLEHVAKLEVLPTLREWRRVLIPGGKLTVRVPDLEWACRWWLKHQTSQDIDIIYGTQGRLGEFHQTGFNKKIMADYLSVAGFAVTKFEFLKTHEVQTLSFECVK